MSEHTANIGSEPAALANPASTVDRSSIPPDVIPQILRPDKVEGTVEASLAAEIAKKEAMRAKLMAELDQEEERLRREDEEYDKGGEVDDDGEDPEAPDPITEKDLNNIDTMTPRELEALIDHVAWHEEWQGLRDRARERVTYWLKGVHRADAAPRCEFVKHDGKRCGSPAVKGETTCYQHGEARTKRLSEEAANILQAPVLEDRAGIQVALTRLLSLLATNAVDEKSARVMLAALRLAHRNLGDSRSVYD